MLTLTDQNIFKLVTHEIYNLFMKLETVVNEINEILEQRTRRECCEMYTAADFSPYLFVIMLFS